jgi:alginate O-acetyltransferase complex protein AlgI
VLFPTTDFAIFFVIVFLGNWLLNPFRRPWKLFMIAMSYVFYAWWDWRFVFLLAGFTVITQLGGLAVARERDDGRRRNVVFGVAIAAALLPLAWFKYYGFLSLNLDDLWRSLGAGGQPVPLLQIILPIGVSFYTFMGISYVFDIYRRTLEPSPWIDVFLFLSFFPHLVAGPIVRARELIPQFARSKDPRSLDATMAGSLIISGLFKKVVLSSFLASSMVDPVFANPAGHSNIEILVAVYAYAVQIYADFSGYTDIAIGCALLLGYEFPKNFDRPYTALNLQDFWRRWHMTLSRWLRDYLYIPLGGSRGSDVRTSVNIMIVMLLGGLWHGAAWTFVVWGGLHGVGQVVGRLRRKRLVAMGRDPLPQTPGRTALARFATFNLVCLGWVFFRSDSFATAFAMLKGLVTQWGSAPLVTLPVLLAVAAGIGVQYLPASPGERIRITVSRMGPALQGVVLGVSLLVITGLGPTGVAPFIYFQF